MKPSAITVALVLLLGWGAPTAAAQDPGDEPAGYEFCGWSDFDGGWSDSPPDGAYVVLFARGMSCTAARRNYRRVRYTRSPPYRPVRTGYRCRTLESAYEFSDVRCTKRGRSSVAFRWRTGA